MEATNTTNTRHEVTVDRKIAEAAILAARTAANAAWYEKNGHRQINGEAKTAEAIEVAAAARQALTEAEADYRGWSRFFLVQNTNGHIHSSLHCSTCRWDTDFAWLPELSGLTEVDAVAEYGEILCSICFPSAPVEWTTGTNKKVAAERELRDALRAIERSPEGKKVKSARELVSSKAYRVGEFERTLRRFAEDGANSPEWLVRDAARAESELPKARKQLANAEAKLATAEAALDLALRA